MQCTPFVEVFLVAAVVAAAASVVVNAALCFAAFVVVAEHIDSSAPLLSHLCLHWVINSHWAEFLFCLTFLCAVRHILMDYTASETNVMLKYSVHECTTPTNSKMVVMSPTTDSRFQDM